MDEEEWLEKYGWVKNKNGYIKTIEVQDLPKSLVRQDRIERMKQTYKGNPMFDEQKHIDFQDSPEKDYWHYGYLMALIDIDRNYDLIEKVDEEDTEEEVK